MFIYKSFLYSPIVLFCIVCFSCSHTGFLSRRCGHSQCDANAGAGAGAPIALEVCAQGAVDMHMYMYMYNFCVLLSSRCFFWVLCVLLVLICASTWYYGLIGLIGLMNTGELFGCFEKHGWKLPEAVQKWIDSFKAAGGCLEALEENRSAKYIMALQA